MRNKKILFCTDIVHKTESMIDGYLEEDLKLLSREEYIDWDAFAGKTFFITGATGLIGSIAAKAVSYVAEMKGFPVKIICFVRDEKKAQETFSDITGKGTSYTELVFLKGDLLHEIDFPEKTDHIIHAANPVGSAYYVSKPVETIRESVFGTDNLLRFALKSEASGVVYISSMEAYGQPYAEKSEITEEDLGYIDILSVRSSYSESKRLNECLCASYADEYGVPVRIARIAQTFGAGVKPSETRIFAQLAKSVIEQKDIVLHTNGLSEGNYCYTRDTVGALLMLLQKGENGQAYTVVNEEAHSSIRDMAEMIAKDIAGGRIKVIYDIPEGSGNLGYAPEVHMRLSGQKLKELGFLPKVGLKEAYERLIGSLSAQMEVG